MRATRLSGNPAAAAGSSSAKVAGQTKATSVPKFADFRVNLYDRESAISYFINNCPVPEKCEKCGQVGTYTDFFIPKVGQGSPYRTCCGTNGCRHKYSLLASTPFKGSKMPPDQLLALLVFGLRFCLPPVGGF